MRMSITMTTFLSDGVTPNTLGGWKSIAEKYGIVDVIPLIDKEIAAAPNGENEEVTLDEFQMMHQIFAFSTDARIIGYTI